MCTHQRWIFNRYSRKTVLVKCGKCEACLQEKASKRTMRIRNHLQPGQIFLFITLTYRPNSIPYILKSEMRSDSPHFIYRGLRHRHVIGEYFVPDGYDWSASWKLKHAVGSSRDCVSVLFYSDIQKFFKRLRQNLIRLYNYDKKISYFVAGEYGSHSQRAHYHLLIACEPQFEATFRSAIAKSWPYSSAYRVDQGIEVARNAASYVASYVNSMSLLDSILSEPVFRPSSHCSKDFGVFSSVFSLDSLLKKIDNGDLSYTYETSHVGKPLLLHLPVPQYVLNRYFPKFKGMSLVDDASLRRIIAEPEVGLHELLCYTKSLNLVHRFKLDDRFVEVNSFDKSYIGFYDFTCEDYWSIYTRLHNCLRRFCQDTGLNVQDYVHYYIRCYRVQFSTNMRLLHSSVVDVGDYCCFYDNFAEVGCRSYPTITGSVYPQYNHNPRNEQLTDYYTDLFRKKDKQRKVTNSVMAAQGFYV